jgi:LPS export ABC transporter protein LptC
MNAPEPRSILSLGLLLIAALFSVYISSGGWSDDKEKSRPELSMAYYLTEAKLTGTGADGRILFEVWANKAAQSPDESGIDMDDVRMNYGPPIALPWELTADAGHIPKDASVIELRGNVLAVSAGEDQVTTIIRTQRLDVDPATRQASTTSRVQLDFDGRIVNATGMEANFETNDLKLLSNVHGKFLP